MIAPIARIALRYFAGALIAKGFADASFANDFAANPDALALVQAGIGAALGGLTEAWYYLARRFGWSK